MDINKGKQKEDIVQDEEVLLYKPYNISSEDSWPKTLEPMFIYHLNTKLFEETVNKTNNIGKKLLQNLSSKNIMLI